MGKNPMPGIALICIVLGVLQAVPAFFPGQRFHGLLAIAFFSSAGSFLLAFWKRSGKQIWDPFRAPLTLLLSVWAIGLFAYCTGIAGHTFLERFAAGFSGSLYVLAFAIEVLERPRLVAFGDTGGSRES